MQARYVPRVKVEKDALDGRQEHPVGDRPQHGPIPRLAVPQCLLGALLLDRDACDISCRLDQPKFLLGGRTRLVVVHGKRAEHLPLRRKDRGGPAGAKAEPPRHLAIVLPEWIGEDVRHHDPGAPEHGRPAGTMAGSDGQTVDGANVFLGKTRCGPMPNVGAVVIEHQHGAPHAGALLLDEPDQAIEHVGERAAGGDHPKDFALGRAHRFVTAPFGDVARDTQQLNHDAVQVCDRRDNDVPPLRHT